MLSFFLYTCVFVLSCSNSSISIPKENDSGTDIDTITCDIEETPSQIRLLTRKEYNSSIYALYYGEGQTCLDDDECLIEESCLYGICRPSPCDEHTFVWPHSGDDVWIAGNFNDWTPQPMSKRNGIWVQTLQLDPGQWIYKFVVDGEWTHDWNGDPTTDDGYGGYNNIFTLQCNDVESILANPSRNFPVESPPQDFGFDNHVGSLVSSTHLLRYIEVAEVLAPYIVEQSGFSIEDFGSRVFRRPLTDEEREKFTSMDPILAIQIMLSSVHFVYRDETETLTDWQLASALSYFLWGSPPDEWLRSLAADGKLRTEIENTIDQMLLDPRSQIQIQNFAIQWLGVQGILTVDKGTYDEFDAVRSSIYKETGEFVADVFFEKGQMEDLLLSTIDPIDDIYETVDAGVLALPAVLASTAHSDQTSPVLRGLFVREHLLCQHLGTPPANAGGVPDIDPNSSTRERFEQHSDDPGCAACHQFIDPIGFGFENYNEIGMWRDYDGIHPVDASGSIYGIDQLGDSSGGAFNSLPELAEMLTTSPRFERCVSEHLMRFAIGREEGRCTAHKLAEGDIQNLMKQMLMSDTFLRRTP